MVEIIPQADALGVMNTAELWSLPVDAAAHGLATGTHAGTLVGSWPC
jgi:hypothetical protein